MNNMSVLKEICNNKKLEIKSLKERFSQSNLLEISKYQEKPRGLKSAHTSKVNNNQFLFDYLLPILLRVILFLYVHIMWHSSYLSNPLNPELNHI